MIATIDSYSLYTTADIQRQIASEMRRIRLDVKGWKQETLAEKSGVSFASVKRFEQTGEISFSRLLRLALALGVLDKFNDLLKDEAKSIRLNEYIEKNKSRSRTRGRK